MKNLARNLVLATGVCMFSNLASALTFDYRHDYLKRWHQNRDRVLIYDRLSNGISYGIEEKFWSTRPRYGSDKKHAKHTTPFNRMDYMGGEYNIDYTFKLSPIYTVSPGIGYEHTRFSTIQKPYITFRYYGIKATSLNLRLRHEYTRDRRATRTRERTQNRVNRSDLYVVHSEGDFTYQLSWMYKHGNTVLYNNRHFDYFYNASVAYNLTKTVTPYVEVGDVSASRYKKERQVRWRMGVKYKF